MGWEIEYTDEFGEWWDALSVGQQDALRARVDLLAEQGPGLRRPTVGEIKGSAFDPQMKEIVCDEGGALRVLFVFDPRRTAILLVGGDKTGSWNRWYRSAISRADDLYRTYLDEIRDEGLI